LYNACKYNIINNLRNTDLIHDGIPPSADTLACSADVAVEFLNVVFPSVLATLGLKVSGYLMIGA